MYSANTEPLGSAVVHAHRSLPVAVIVSLRPKQWTKNLIVFAGLIFSQRLTDLAAAVAAAGAFLAFCALSSTVYLVNDLRDREADRLHPAKCRRPIATGDLPPAVAGSIAALLGMGSLAYSFWLSPAFGAVAAVYLVLLVAYSVSLKHIVILDVLTLAMGFVLRVWGGAAAIPVPVSHWLLLMVLLGALFLALAKRRAELVALAADAHLHRPILAHYSPYLLDQMIGVVTAATLVAYALYTIDADTVARFGTKRLVWTVPFPLYGIFRYLYLVHQREGGGNPSEILVTDPPILACVALWTMAVVALLYWPVLIG